MKKVVLLIAAICLVQLSVSAQTKLGHINSQELLNAMPEKAAAEQQMATFRDQLEKRMVAIQADYQEKVKAFEALDPNTPQSTIEDMRNDIITMQGRIQEYPVNAEQEMMAKNEELLTPMLAKLQDAITAVGKENGYNYIFDIGNGTGFMVYEDGEDLTDIVKAKLGL
jgi:outer membrane protein